MAEKSTVARMDYPAYKEIPEKEKYLRSIKNNIVAILGADSDARHKKDLLDICIWQITEIDGKYKARYRSEGAMNKQNWKTVQHEHVYQRKHLIECLLNDHDIEALFTKAVACLVTKEEHDHLSNTLIGWNRYKDAQIKVYDLKEQKLLNWESMQE
ncbi:MAG TPA: hypothetical protein VN374_02030 [Desulfitobacteriaceae bacterium]|nr:hypothetical protein [Desulfitobacteriaceae bacterium]